MGRILERRLELADIVDVERADRTRLGLILGVGDAPVVGRNVQIFPGSRLAAGRTVEAGRAVSLRVWAVGPAGPVEGRVQTLGFRAALEEQHLRGRCS